MRRLHLLAGLLGVPVFVLSGQVVRLHHTPTRSVEAGQRMMSMSRHVCILGNALVNLVLGAYLIVEHPGCRIGFEPAFPGVVDIGVCGRTGRRNCGSISGFRFGWFTLLGGTLLHLFARPQREPRTQPN